MRELGNETELGEKILVIPAYVPPSTGEVEKTAEPENVTISLELSSLPDTPLKTSKKTALPEIPSSVLVGPYLEERYGEGNEPTSPPSSRPRTKILSPENKYRLASLTLLSIGLIALGMFIDANQRMEQIVRVGVKNGNKKMAEECGTDCDLDIACFERTPGCLDNMTMPTNADCPTLLETLCGDIESNLDPYSLQSAALLCIKFN